MKSRREIIIETIAEMPSIFTSQEFNELAIKKGYPEKLIKKKGLSRYINKYADNEFKYSKTWKKKSLKTKSNIEEMEINETTLKYLNALKELKKVLEYQPNLGLQPFCNHYGLSKNTSVEIIKGGLVKNIGKRGPGRKYVWNTIEPNINMAKELLSRVNEISRKSTEKSRSKGKTQKCNPILDYSETKLLWGLIKITTKYYFKNEN